MTTTAHPTKATQSDVAGGEMDDELFTAGRPRPRRGRRVLTLAVVVVVVALVGVAIASTRTSGPEYRVATVTNADASAVLNGVATIEPVSQATVAFPTSGTVKAVAVKVGQTVRAGQTLAALDSASLYETVHSKEASLAQAKLNLQNALDGKSSGLSSGGGGSGGGGSTSGSNSATLAAAVTPSTPSATSATEYAVRTATTTPTTTPTTPTSTPSTKGGNPGSGGGRGSTSSSNPQIAAAQRAVVAAQAKVDAALAAADAAMRAAETVCGGTSGHSAPAGVSPPGGPTTTAASTTSTTTGGPPPGGSCTTALQASLAAQQAVSTAQRALDTAAQNLTKLLDAQASNPSTPTGKTGGGGASSTPSGLGSGQSTTKTASAADLAAYQVRVDTAATNLLVAIQSLSQARITTPISGTVLSVNMAKGDSVSAGSSTANIVVSGNKGYEVTTSVAVTQIARVSVGQAASVLPDGAAGPITGTVSSISQVPASTSGSTTTYRVIVSFANPSAALHNGATGSVTIITDAAKAALVVPSSAVHTTNNRHTVTVSLGGSSTKTVNVTIGVQGATTTQVKSGLAAGQRVVIADLHQALPNSATQTQSTANNRNNRNGFTFPAGGGGPPAGFGGFGGGGRGN